MIQQLLLSLQMLASPAQFQNTEFWMKNLQSSSVDLRLNAIQRLQEIKDPESVSAIQNVLDDSDPEIRSAAARALGKMPYETALRALEGSVSGEKDSYVKSELNRSIRGLKATFKKQEEKAKGIKSSAPADSESDETDSLGE